MADKFGPSPLDHLIPGEDPKKEPVESPQNARKAPAGVRRPPAQQNAPQAPTSRKIRFTVNIDAGLAEQVKDAAYWTRETVAAITERAYREELQRIRKREGGEIPKREGELKTGRPLKRG